jgi:hypothetical protein
MRLLTLDRLDGRTAAARRARELIEAIEADFGGSARLSEGSRQLVQRARCSERSSRIARRSGLAARWELADYLAAINSQRRLLATIGLERRARDVETLEQYLDRRVIEQPEDNEEFVP